MAAADRGVFGQDVVRHHEGFPRYSDSEMERRHGWVADTMAEFDLDGVVVGGATGPLETSVQFFSNWPPQVVSFLLFTPADPPVLLVRLWNHLPDAQRISMVTSVEYGGDSPAEQAHALTDRLAARKPHRVGLVGSIPHGDLAVLQAGLPDCELVDLNPRYQTFRLVKSEEEMVFTRVASRMNDAAVAALAAEFRPGMYEYEMARIVESAYLGHRGVNLIHFSLTTPMDDPQLPVPHQFHPDRQVQAGDVFVTEISTTFWGYAGQILRTFTMGADPTPRFARLHEVALGVYESIVELLRPGVTVGEILDRADAVTKAGFDIWDDLVHGFGGAYLPPIIRTRASRGATHPDGFVYPAGALIVVQPNVIDGNAGVQVGNSVWVTADGPEITQAYPLEITRLG